MADAELETLRTQVMALQQQAEHRAQAWGRIRIVSGGLALFLTIMALAFIVVSAWLDPNIFPTAHQFVQIMGYQFLFTSLPLSLLTLALQASDTARPSSPLAGRAAY